MKKSFLHDLRAFPFWMVFALIQGFALNVDAQVSFTQTTSGDFVLGHMENVQLPGDNVSFPAKGTGFNNWLTATVLPDALAGHRLVTFKQSYVYCIGGNNGLVDKATVYRATIQSNSNSGWTTQNALPVALVEPAVAVGMNMIYVIGGKVNGVPVSTIYYATLASDGTVGTWQTSPVSLPAALWGHTAHYANGFLYILGGSSSASETTASAGVYVATLNVNSVITQIQSTTALPAPRNGHSSVVNGNQLVVMGGIDNGGAKTNTVYVANLLSNGQVNSWQATNPLPISVSHHATTCFNGFLTLIAGEEDVAGVPTLSNKMYYTNLSNFPTLSWSLMSDPLYDYTKKGQAFAANGIICYEGGINLSGFPVYTGRYSTVTTNSEFVKTGTFVSYPFFQLGDNRNLLSLTYSFSPVGGATLYYRLASNDGVWSDWYTGTASPSLINQFKRYVQYMFVFNGTGLANYVLNDVTLSMQGTQLSGNLNAYATLTAANSPYWATGNISFTAGTHTIEPGVTILFSPNTGLEIGAANMLFNGTAANPILLTYYTNESGQWNGVYFNENSDSGASSDLLYTIIEKAGNSGNSNLRCYATQEPYVNHCTFRQADGHGVSLSSAALTIENSLIEDNTEQGIYLSNSSPALIGTTLDGNGQAAIYMGDQASNPTYSACLIQNNLFAFYHSTCNKNITPVTGTVTVINNIRNGHAIPGGSINSNVSWYDPSLEFFVMGSIAVGQSQSKCRLTIEPGGIVNCNTGVTIQIGYVDYYHFGGELYALGSETLPIVFRAINQSPGGWNGLYFADPSDSYGAISMLDHCTIRDGATSSVSCATTSQPTILNSLIGYSSGTGLYLSNATPTISNSSLVNNGTYPLYFTNPNYFYYTPALISNITFSGNLFNGPVLEGGTISSTKTLFNFGSDTYYFLGNIILGAYPTPIRLTVNPGLNLRFKPGTGMQIGFIDYYQYGGELWANGTEASPITFKSYMPDTTWTGLYFHTASDASGATSKLYYCTIEKGQTDNVYCDNTSQPLLDHCILRNSNGYGIRLMNNSMVQMSNTAIQDNGNYPIYFNNVNYFGLWGYTFTNLSVTGNPVNGIVLEGGTLGSTRIWNNYGNNLYYVLSSITVGAYPTPCRLTLDPGIQVNFKSTASLNMGYIDYYQYGGEIWTVAPSGNKTMLTSWAPDTSWGGLYFDNASDANGATSKLVNCILEKGNAYNLYCSNSFSLTLDSCIIRNGGGYGVRLVNAMLNMSNTSILNHPNYGLYFNNAYYINYGGLSFNNLYLQGNLLDHLVSEGMSTGESRTWNDFGNGDYVLFGNIGLGGYPTTSRLTINPGVTVRFKPGTGFNLGWPDYYSYSGEIWALGTEALPITFTSLNPDSTWNGFAFNDQSDANGGNTKLQYSIIENCLDYNIYSINTSSPKVYNCIIRNAPKGFYLNNAGISIYNSRISEHSDYGVYITQGTTPVIGNSDSTGCDFWNNGLYNVYNGSTNVVNARYNYWGQIDSVGITTTTYDYFDNSAKGKIASFPNYDFPQNFYNSIVLTGELNYSNNSATVMSADWVALTAENDTVSTTTTGTGTFDMGAVPRNSYKYAFNASPEVWGGVNSTDALLILRHFAHLDTLEGNLFSVGDVNMSRTLNGTDAMLVMKRYTGLISSFPAGDYFYYLNDFTFDEDSIYNDLRFQWMGDVNGSYLPSGAKSNPVLYHNDMLTLTPGTEVIVPVSLLQGANLAALSLSMDFPSAYLEFTEAILAAPGQTLYTRESDGTIRLAWANLTPLTLNAGDVLVYLKFQVTTVPEGFSLNLSLNSGSEMADPFGQAIEVFMNTPELQGSIVTGLDDLPGFQLGEISPNPAGNSGILTYTLPESANVDLGLYNNLGQLVLPLESGNQSAGSHTLRLDLSALQPGIYFCRLTLQSQSGRFSRVNKLMISR